MKYSKASTYIHTYIHIYIHALDIHAVNMKTIYFQRATSTCDGSRAEYERGTDTAMYVYMYVCMHVYIFMHECTDKRSCVINQRLRL